MNFARKLKEEILPKVQKPGQYLALEEAAHKKTWSQAKSKLALIYPDLYELGMANFGIKVLYNIINQHPDYLCDRAYCVMPDMEKLLEEHSIKLWGWESLKPLSDFDFLGFSLAYELCYPNILTILNLAGLKFYSKDRDNNSPLIFAGGPAVFNPEPSADFFDFYIIGDGEELIIEIQDTLIACKFNRQETLKALSKLQGIYVPSFYRTSIESNFIPIPILDAPYPINKRITQKIDKYNDAIFGPVPLVEVVQDKQILEIRRGCDRGCRFCQVGYTYLPVRERSPEDLLELSKQSVTKTGYENFTLLSLSASDYTCLIEAAKAINDEHSGKGIALSMPSQRADRFNLELANELSLARKSGMTFAPEAGSERLRRIINKGLSQEEIHNAIKNSYQSGWSHIKLYFMIGLPFETDEDLDGILDILTWSVNMSKQVRKINPELALKNIHITCTISTFVPKSFTPFQWYAQVSTEEFLRKQNYLRNGIKERFLGSYVKLNCTDPNIALIEAVLSRGDRRWSKVIESLWLKGSRLGSWSENFEIDIWRKAALDFDLDLEKEASCPREPGSKQVWDILSIGFTEKFLLDEWLKASQEAETEPCTENKCHACGVCFNLGVSNLVSKNLSHANPFVTEIDRSKTQTICASDKPEKILTQNGPTIVVKNTKSVQKLRLKISKLGDLRFISHLDFQRLVERSLRKTNLPIVHSTGYNQRMKITWGTALPLFVESEGEYIEIDLAEFCDNLENLKKILNQELPEQARILEVVSVSPSSKLSISDVLETVYIASLNVVSSGFSISGISDKPGLISQIKDSVLDLMSQEELIVERVSKGKQKFLNIRTEIISIKFLSDFVLELTLRKTQRADDVLKLILPGALWNLRKTSQKFAAEFVA